ncbi:ead/Ea22-like family protein [Salmonella enterica]|nr:ead/Ea22-like family protein [Salmonella enterica]
MSNIDKRALREAAEKALPAMQRLLMMPNDELFDEALLNVDGDVDAANAFNLLAGPETMLSLLDELEADEEQIKTLESRNRRLEGIIDAAEKRIAELERSETQLINERDDSESALNDAYKAVMGQAPEWSNWFSFADAIDEIELACRLWRNQTEDVIQFRQCIAELEAKLANPVLLPKTNGYWNEQEKAYEEAITLARRQIRLAGFRCEGDE